MTLVKPLSEAQKRILSNAATRLNRTILPLPDDFRARGAARQKVLTSLIKQGLVSECPTTDDTTVWRRDARNRRLTLALTAAGGAAAGIAPDASIAPLRRRAARSRPADAPHSNEALNEPATDTPKAASATTAPRGKLAAILAAMATEHGATLAALVDLTGWLPHTMRAALSRLRQRGHPICLVGAAGSKAYRLEANGEG